MSKSIPDDVEEFLYTLGTLQVGNPSALEEYAKTAATLLWEKYVFFADAPVNIRSDTYRRFTGNPKRQN